MTKNKEPKVHRIKVERKRSLAYAIEVKREMTVEELVAENNRLVNEIETTTSAIIDEIAVINRQLMRKVGEREVLKDEY